LRIYDADAGVYISYAAILWESGKNREAISAADAGLRLVQNGYTRATLLLLKAYACEALGQTAEANKAIDEGISSGGPIFGPQFVGILAMVGRRDEANRILAALEKFEHPPIQAMVFAYAGLGDDRVFDWIHAAIDHHTAVVYGLRVGPLFSEFRKDPRWAEVMAHLESEEAKGRAQHRGSS
jgi:tetratricopeptide (TPR) repeat protein